MNHVAWYIVQLFNSCKYFLISTENQPFPESVCLVEINENEGSEEVNRKLRETFHIDDVDLVLKVSLHNWLLKPISTNIFNLKPLSVYQLPVCNGHLQRKKNPVFLITVQMYFQDLILNKDKKKKKKITFA